MRRIQVYTDGSQALIDGPMNIKSMNKELSEEYEVDIESKEFRKMMEEPDRHKVRKMKNKRLINRGRIVKNPPRS